MNSNKKIDEKDYNKTYNNITKDFQQMHIDNDEQPQYRQLLTTPANTGRESPWMPQREFPEEHSMPLGPQAAEFIRHRQSAAAHLQRMRIKAKERVRTAVAAAAAVRAAMNKMGPIEQAAAEAEEAAEAAARATQAV